MMLLRWEVGVAVTAQEKMAKLFCILHCRAASECPSYSSKRRWEKMKWPQAKAKFRSSDVRTVKAR